VLQADDIWLALERATTPQERPSLHFFARRDVWRLPVDEIIAGKRALATEVSDALELVIATHLRDNDRVVVEGVWIMPELAVRPTYADRAREHRVRAVYIDEREESVIYESMMRRGNFSWWSDDDRMAFVRLQARWSEWLNAEAAKHGLPVVAARPISSLWQRVAVAAGIYGDETSS
jgi:2-phosphoglycerate kinase